VKIAFRRTRDLARVCEISLDDGILGGTREGREDK